MTHTKQSPESWMWFYETMKQLHEDVRLPPDEFWSRRVAVAEEMSTKHPELVDAGGATLSVTMAPLNDIRAQIAHVCPEALSLIQATSVPLE